MNAPHEDNVERRLTQLAAIEPDPKIIDRAMVRVEQALQDAVISRKRAMKARFAAAALILLAVGGVVFALLGKSTPLALASVQERLARVESITATQTTFVAGKATDKSTIRLLKSGLVRVDQADGGYTVMDVNRRECLMVNPKLKRATLLHNMAPRTPVDLYEQVRKLSDKATRTLGERTLDGKTAAGFVVPYDNECGKGEITLWVDVKTSLPIRMEASGRDEKEQEVQGVIDGIVFDQPLEVGLFSLAPPDGYQLVEQGVNRPIPPAPRDRLDLVLTPRVGLGPVKFGMTKQEVIDALGEPDIIQRNVGLEYFSRGYSFIVSSNPKRGLSTIQCFSQATLIPKVNDFTGKTSEGIALGATREAIEKAYGKADEVEVRNQNTMNLKYRRQGLGFLLFNNKLVSIWAERD